MTVSTSAAEPVLTFIRAFSVRSFLLRGRFHAGKRQNTCRQSRAAYRRALGLRFCFKNKAARRWAVSLILPTFSLFLSMASENAGQDVFWAQRSLRK